jgi:hypothetical protein
MVLQNNQIQKLFMLRKGLDAQKIKNKKRIQIAFEIFRCYFMHIFAL